MEKTIDKQAFKVNLGIIATIVLSTAAIVGMYYNIQIELQKINYKLVDLTERLANFDERISRLEDLH